MRAAKTLFFNTREFIELLYHPECYKAQEWLRFFLKFLFPFLQNMPRFAFHQASIVCDGFAHSANTFTTKSLSNSKKIISHIHRPWAISEGLRHGIPTIALIRRPYEAISSLIYRTNRSGDWRRLYFEIALLRWIAYYRYVEKVKDQVCLIEFEQITTNYQQVRQHLIQIGFPQLNETPSPVKNSYDGPREPLKLSPLARYLLRKADDLFENLKAESIRQIQSAETPHQISAKKYLEDAAE